MPSDSEQKVKAGHYKCNCRTVVFFNASLIPQPWMRKKSHVPATLCNCGKVYFCYVDNKVYEAKRIKP